MSSNIHSHQHLVEPFPRGWGPTPKFGAHAENGVPSPQIFHSDRPLSSVQFACCQEEFQLTTSPILVRAYSMRIPPRSLDGRTTPCSLCIASVARTISSCVEKKHKIITTSQCETETETTVVNADNDLNATVYVAP